MTAEALVTTEGPEGTRLAGHDDRPVFVTADGLVAKRYASPEGAAAASATLTALWRSTFGETRTPPGVPRPEPLESGSRTLLMERLDGPTLSTRGVLPPADQEAGAAVLLAELHASGVQVGRTRSARGVVRSLRRKAADLADDALGPSFAAVADRAARHLPADGTLVPTHGDFSPRNLMVTATGLRLIDFDRFQMASPARDVAYWGAWHWSTALLRDTEPSWVAGDEFVATYAARRPGAARDVHEGLGFHRAAALLRIVHGWSALAVRRDAAARILLEADRQLG